MEFWSDIGALLSAFASQDSYEIRNAMKSDAVWVFGTLAAIIGGLVVMWIYTKVPLLDKHLERTIMVWSYLAIAFIIFWGRDEI